MTAKEFRQVAVRYIQTKMQAERNPGDAYLAKCEGNALDTLKRAVSETASGFEEE